MVKNGAGKMTEDGEDDEEREDRKWLFLLMGSRESSSDDRMHTSQTSVTIITYLTDCYSKNGYC